MESGNFSRYSSEALFDCCRTDCTKQTVCPCTRELTLLAGLTYSQSWILAIFHQRTHIVLNCIPAVLPKFLLFTMALVCCPVWVDGGRQILKHPLSNINAAQLVIHYCWLSKAARVEMYQCAWLLFSHLSGQNSLAGPETFCCKRQSHLPET